MMSVYQLAVKSLRYRKFTLVLSILSIALSVMLLLGVERIRNQVNESFSSTISGTDLIVGSRTGSASLLLSSVFHIGFPNQNMQYETFEKIAEKPQVKWALPFSLGDSHKGFPVLGITQPYFEHFRYGKKQKLNADTGVLDIQNRSAVLGAKAAKDLGYSVGDPLIITHGGGDESFIEHSDQPFKVTAILNVTGTPVDQTIHVSLFAMDAIHREFEGGHPHHDPLMEALAAFEEEHTHKEPEQITGFLLGLENKSDILMMQRALNTYQDEPLTAIMPVVTLMELWAVVKPMEKALIGISILVLIVAFAGMLTTIMTSLNERRREMAILRSVGAKSKHIFRLIMLEAFGVSISGILAGVLLLQVVLLATSPFISAKLGMVLKIQFLTLTELLMLAIILIGGLLIGIFPAYRSYKNSLADGLMVKV